jgi:hypothetical protein
MQEHLNFQTEQEGLKKIQELRDLQKQMVGQLYPGIVEEEISEIRNKIWDIKYPNEMTETLVERPKSKQKAIIVDIDGTIALFKGNGPNGEDLRKPFYVEDEECHHYLVDKPNLAVMELIVAMQKQGYRIIFCSGRTDNNFAVTVQWLMEHLPNEIVTYNLFMRKKGDFRKDSEIKMEIYRNEIEPNFDVLFTVDDRNQVVQMYRELGLVCMQVAPGDF